jgi:hypothetical protein
MLDRERENVVMNRDGNLIWPEMENRVFLALFLERNAKMEAPGTF